MSEVSGTNSDGSESPIILPVGSLYVEASGSLMPDIGTYESRNDTDSIITQLRALTINTSFKWRAVF
jgi:hypothetical protein